MTTRRGVLIAIAAVLAIVWGLRGTGRLSGRAVGLGGLQTQRVGPTGSDAAGCGEEATPCRTIQFAVNQIAIGSSGTILVAGSPAGVRYTFEPGSDVCSGKPPGMTGVVCVVQKSVVIRGGFSTENWATSVPETNRTIIDGEDLHRGVFVSGPAPATRFELRGFTIEKGRADAAPVSANASDPVPSSFGGGVYIFGAQRVTLRDLILRDNQAIGTDVRSESEFDGAGAGGIGAGGGIQLYLVRDAVLENLRFEGNAARGGSGPACGGFGSGGGLSTNDSTVVGRALTFTGNLAAAGDTAGKGFGPKCARPGAFGGAATFEKGSRIILERVVAAGNSALGGSAQIFGSGAFGGAFKVELADVSLMAVDVRDNLAEAGKALDGEREAGGGGGIAEGGGVEAIHSDLVLSRAMIIGNVARGGDGTTGNKGPVGGGGLATVWVPGDPAMPPPRDMILEISNSIIAGNSAEEGAGKTTSGGGGGGLFLQATTATIDHTTIAGNVVKGSLAGQAIELMPSSFTPDARFTTAEIRHTIIADHVGAPTAALHVVKGNTAKLSNGLFANNRWNANVGDAPLPAGTFLGLETMLSAPSVEFVSPGSPSFDYHLGADSPARDRATGTATSRDIDGDGRALDVAADIGADEVVPGVGEGSLSGRLADSVGGPAISVSVTAFDAHTNALVSSTLSDEDGRYEIAGLPGGSYKIRFGMNEGPGAYIGKWFPSAPGAPTATAVAVGTAPVGNLDAVLARAPFCGGFSPTIVGTNGNDKIRGGAGRDVVVGAGGRDEIDGGDGDDILCGGGGKDTLVGGLGDDSLDGGQASDVLKGEAGKDVLRGQAGDDRIEGGGGDDDLRDAAGANTLVGGDGTDRCNARSGNTLELCER